MKLKVFEAFSGYGSQSMALKRLGIDYETVGISEIDKYAIQAYNAVHGYTPNYGDISKIDWDSVSDFDLFTYSFPCTDISNAGQQAGLAEGSGTRSSLLWECKRAIEEKKPKYLLMENVSALVGSKFINYYQQWELYLSNLGYSNYSQVLNAKDYGVPQNRERIFMVSMLDCDTPYYFPIPVKLDKRLKDILESNVDEKYYLSPKFLECMVLRNKVNKERGNGFKFEPTFGDNVARSVTTHAGNRTDDNFIKVIGNSSKCQTSQAGKVYSNDGIMPTICAGTHGYANGYIQDKGSTNDGNIAIITPLDSKQEPMSNPKILIKNNTHKGYIPCNVGGVFSLSQPNSTTRRGRVINNGEIAPTRTTQQDIGYVEPDCKEPKIIDAIYGSGDLMVQDSGLLDYRIRKLTERECFRLMDVSENDIDKLMTAGISKTQLYKMAGNSIVVAVLMAIFDKLFINTEQDLKQQLKMF